jgi:hypothetical protein
LIWNPEVVALLLRVEKRRKAHLDLDPEVAIVPPKPVSRSEGKAARVVERI